LPEHFKFQEHTNYDRVELMLVSGLIFTFWHGIAWSLWVVIDRKGHQSPTSETIDIITE